MGVKLLLKGCHFNIIIYIILQKCRDFNFLCKKIYVIKQSLLTALIAVSGFAAFAQKEHHKVIAIGFYNVENFFDTEDNPAKQDEDFTPKGPYGYTTEVYTAKKHNIATALSKLGTDVTPDGPAIIGIAEVENEGVLKDLAKEPELKSRNYQVVCFPTPDERGISTAMMYNPKYFRVLSASPHHVPLESIGKKRPTRDVLYVCGILAGDTVHILVNHWPSKSGGEAASAPARRIAAQTAKNLIDSLQKANPNNKILLMGDLNDNPTSDGVINVLQARAFRKDLTATDIYNPWINMYKNGLGTESFRGEWNLIDQIMISGAFVNNTNNKWQYLRQEIFNREFLKNSLGRDRGLPHRSFTVNRVWDNGYSDHFPVVMYFIEK